MKKSLQKLLIVALGAFALLAAGCSSSGDGSASGTTGTGAGTTPGSAINTAVPTDDDVALTIDGVDYTYGDVKTERPSFAFGTADATFQVDFLVRQVLVANELEARGRTDFSAEDQLLQELLLREGLSGNTAEETEQLVEEIRLAYDIAGLAPMTEAQARAEYDADPTLNALTCTRHILHDTEADALETLDLLVTGRPFAEVAAERSTGPTASEGGDLGCNPAGTMVPLFDEAQNAGEVNEIIGPIETEFGWHVLTVYDRQVQPFDAAPIQKARLFGDLETATGSFFSTMTSHEVVIDPRLGVWSPTEFQVLPPGSPEQSPFATAAPIGEGEGE